MNWYFTFGQSHATTDGIQMKDHWIRVVADDFWEARSKFIEKFSSIRMDAADKWAFQYSEDEFDKIYFPGGEFAEIN